MHDRSKLFCFARALSSLILALTATISLAQDNSFYRKYNLYGMQGGLHLKSTEDGGFIATGQHEGNGSAGGCDVYVYRVDECGNILWFRLYGSGGSEGGKSIVETSDGGFIVSGHWADAVGFVMRLNSAGDLLWFKRFDGTDWIFYANELSDGGVIAAGRNGGAVALMRCDINGNLLWARRITGIGEFPLSVEQGPDEKIYLISSYNVPSRDISAASLDIDGNLLWCKGYGTGWYDNDHTAWSGRGIYDERDTSFVVTSPIISQGFGGEDVLFMKLNPANGDIVWSKAIGGAGSDQPREIELTDSGYAIIGNSNSFPFSVADDPIYLSENMGERDVLLLHTDMNGDEIWSRTYGASARDKGIGVAFNADRTFTMSAYTASGFFGNGDGSMDPLFIKTDTLGVVACQTGFPEPGFADISISSANIGSIGVASISVGNVVPAITNLNINDDYQCQLCYTEPVFTPSDTIICVGEPVEFYNITTVGLSCFQEWIVNGDSFPGNIDTLSYVFFEPGTYTTQLYSSCGEFSQTYEINIHVVEVELSQTLTSNYNGFEVSCPGASDGWISSGATGGHFEGAQQYHISWTPELPGGFQPSNLTAGIYQLLVADDIGCSDSITIVLDEPEPLQASIQVTSDYNGSDISCFGGSDGSALASVSGGVGQYTIDWLGNGQFSGLSGSNLSAGSFSIEIFDANGCSTFAEVTLTEPQPIQGVIEITSDYNGVPISCPDASDGSMMLVSANGGIASAFTDYQLQWLSGVPPCELPDCMSEVPGISGSTIDNITEGWYAVEITDLNGCIGYAVQEIIDPSPVQADIVITSDYNGWPISCYNASDASLLASAVGGVPGYAFEWPGIANTPDIEGLPVGVYSVVVSDANLCQDSISIEVIQPSPLELQVEVTSDYNGAQISCFDSADGELLATPGGGVSPYQFQWSNGQTTDYNAFQISAGSYEIDVTDANGCLISSEIQVIPPPAITGNTQILTDYNGFDISCYGAMDAEIQATSQGGTGSLSYSWDGNISGPANLDDVTSGAGLLQVNITDINGCILTLEVDVLQPEPLLGNYDITSDYNGFPISCHGATDAEIIFAGNGGAPAYTFDYNNAGYSNGESVSNLGAGSWPVIVTDANGCEFEFDVVINEPEPLSLTVAVYSDYNGADISCYLAADGEAVAQAEGGVPGYQVAWSNGGVGFFSGANLGPGLISAQVTDLNGCTANNSTTLTEPEPVVISLVNISNYNGYEISCFGFTDGLLEVSSTGGTGGNSYLWNGVPGDNLNFTLSAGEQSVIAIDLNACADTLIIPFLQPEPLVCQTEILEWYNGFPISCYGASDGSASVSVSGGIEPYIHVWNPGTMGEQQAGMSAGLYTVTSTDANGCMVFCDLILSQPLPLEIEFLVVPDTCGRVVGSIQPNVDGGVTPYNYTWSAPIPLEVNDSESLNSIPTGDYTLEITDQNNCQLVAETSVTEIPGPEISIHYVPDPVCTDMEVHFRVESDKELVDYYWHFGDGNTSPLPNPVHIYQTSGIFPIELLVEDLHSCPLLSGVNLLILPGISLYVPNSFTPNNDGNNDFFFAKGEGIETFHMQIFNRWGESVFETSDINEPWIGNHQDGEYYVEPGVYIYKIRFGGICAPEKDMTGHVTLVR